MLILPKIIILLKIEEWLSKRQQTPIRSILVQCVVTNWCRQKLDRFDGSSQKHRTSNRNVRTSIKQYNGKLITAYWTRIPHSYVMHACWVPHSFPLYMHQVYASTYKSIQWNYLRRAIFSEMRFCQRPYLRFWHYVLRRNNGTIVRFTTCVHLLCIVYNVHYIWMLPSNTLCEMFEPRVIYYDCCWFFGVFHTHASCSL